MSEKKSGSRLVDLNDALFTQLNRLSDKDLKGEGLREEIDRAKAVSTIARDIIENARLALDAHRTQFPGGSTPPAMLGIEAK